MNEQIAIKPGTFIVFEGLDATGKSTQINRLQEAAEGRFGNHLFSDPVPMFTRQPAGEGDLGQLIYELTESPLPMSGWTRQFLHLASHSNHYLSSILPALQERAVFMDRCWWSTFAYGYYAGRIHVDMPMPDEFIRLITIPTRKVMPSVLFLFTHPWQDDPHNTGELIDGYNWLERAHGGSGIPNNYPLVKVPPLDTEQTTLFIINALVDLGFAA